MKNSSWLIVALFALGLSSGSFAKNLGNTEDLYPALRLEPYEGKSSVYLEAGQRYVKKVYVTAEAISCQSATLEISAYGNGKGTIQVPCHGTASSWIGVNESVSALQFRVTAGGSVRVTRVYAEMEPLCPPPCVNCGPCPQPIVVQPVAIETEKNSDSMADRWPSRPSLAWLAKKARKLTDSLRPHVDPAKQYVKHLVPIRSLAGHAEAVTMAEGDASEKSKVASQALADRITQADSMLTVLMTWEVTFDMATEMVRVRDEILDALD